MTDVIVISTKPGRDAACYAEILAKQTSPIEKLIIVRAPGCSAETDAFQTADGGIKTQILQSEFASAGYMLTQGVRASSSDRLLFLSEDASAVSDELTEKLGQALTDETAMAFARTLPGEKSTRIRDAYQAFLNPSVSEDRTACNLFQKGILHFYTGGSAVMLTREALALAGGFDAEALTDPFSIVAAELFYLGKTLRYEADAVVSRIKENESTDSDGSLSVSYEYYVQYYTQSGELVEAKLGNPPYDLIQGTQLRIKYLPEKPNYAIFVK